MSRRTSSSPSEIQEAGDRCTPLLYFGSRYSPRRKSGHGAGGSAVVVSQLREFNQSLTGDGLKKIQLDMASFESKYAGAELVSPPESHFKEILGCFRCRNIPDPKNYMQCEEKGHMICASCVISEIQIQADSTSKSKSREEGEEVSCCALENLQRGHPRILQFILDTGMWRCVNWETGCSAQFKGTEWASHMRACNYLCAWACQFFGCTDVYPSMNELVAHYKDCHGADVFQPAGKAKNTFHIPVKDILDKGSKEDRKLALLSFRECLFIYAVELKEGNVHMWVWSVDNPIVKAMNDVEYSIRLFVEYSKDSGRKPKSFDRFKGIAKTYGKHLPEDMMKMRRAPDQPTCAPSVGRHFIISEELFRAFAAVKVGVPLVMIGLKECQEQSLECRIAQRKLKA